MIATCETSFLSLTQQAKSYSDKQNTYCLQIPNGLYYLYIVNKILMG